MKEQLLLPVTLSAKLAVCTAVQAHSRNRESLEELVDLLVGHLLAELRQDVAELSGTDESVSGLVEHLEALDELVWWSATSGPQRLGSSLSGQDLLTGSSGRLPAVGAVEDLEELVVVDCWLARDATPLAQAFCCSAGYGC